MKISMYLCLTILLICAYFGLGRLVHVIFRTSLVATIGWSAVGFLALMHGMLQGAFYR
ncbi:hypothetical protein BCF11_2995 [Collimonas sp. PA-H2]|nr:hypothetical protein BCF11_2995 [Collimonas sp. PA-H2]